MSDLSAYHCTPRQTRAFVIRCMRAGLSPFIKSSPAMGKSALVRSIAEEYQLQLIDHRLSTSAPEDLSGLPFRDGDVSRFLPFDTFPTEDTPLPEGKQGWLLFLDEANSAAKPVQAAAYKLVLDRMTGQKKLNPMVVIVLAGNLETDRAIVNPLSTAMQSRVVTLVMRLEVDEFIKDVALPYDWDRRIIAFLSYKPTMLHDFKPDHSEHTFCAPRTWDFVNKLIKGRDIDESDSALLAGAITSGVAMDFIQFTKVYGNLQSVDSIVKDPEGTPLPTDAATRWATITHLVDHATDKNLDKVATYVNRLPSEFRVLFFRSLMIQKSELRPHPAFRAALTSLARYLYDDNTPATAAA